MYTKVQLQERLVELIHDKYRIISKVEDENSPFKKIYETQKKVFFWFSSFCPQSKTLRQIKKQPRWKMPSDASNSDVRQIWSGVWMPNLFFLPFYFFSVHEAIQKADLEDAEALKRFAAQKDKSERFLHDNIDKQVCALPPP